VDTSIIQACAANKSRAFYDHAESLTFLAAPTGSLMRRTQFDLNLDHQDAFEPVEREIRSKQSEQLGRLDIDDELRRAKLRPA
jgi:hypothetical protein